MKRLVFFLFSFFLIAGALYWHKQKAADQERKQVFEMLDYQPANDRDIKIISAFEQEYFDSRTREKKLSALQKMLQHQASFARVVFYRALTKSEPADITIFRQAVADYGNCRTLTDLDFYFLNEFTLTTQKAAKAIMRGRSVKDLSEEEKEDLINVAEKNQQDINGFILAYVFIGDSIRELARQNMSCLITVLKKRIAVAESPGDYFGAMMPLQLLGEDGFTPLLEDLLRAPVVGQTAQLMVKSFEGHAVIPLLKAIENPGLSKRELQNAIILINELSNSDSTLDKVIEAYQHGSYLPNSDGSATAAWMPFLTDHYQNQTDIADYFLENYLDRPEMQASAIKFLRETNYQYLCLFLTDLPPEGYARLNDDSLAQLLLPPQNFQAFGRDTTMAELYLNLAEKLPAERQANLRLTESCAQRLINLRAVQKYLLEAFPHLPPGERAKAIRVANSLPAGINTEVCRKLKPLCTKAESQLILY